MTLHWCSRKSSRVYTFKKNWGGEELVSWKQLTRFHETAMLTISAVTSSSGGTWCFCVRVKSTVSSSVELTLVLPSPWCAFLSFLCLIDSWTWALTPPFCFNRFVFPPPPSLSPSLPVCQRYCERETAFPGAWRRFSVWLMLPSRPAGSGLCVLQ